MVLLSNRDQVKFFPSFQFFYVQFSKFFQSQGVVAESVVVIKKLLQTQAGDHKDIIVHMAKLVDSIKVAEARAAILWVIGEYSDRVPKIAPGLHSLKIYISQG